VRGEQLVRAPEKWTGEVTAVWTGEGGSRLWVVLDLCSRRVIGGAMAAGPDEARVAIALRLAVYWKAAIS
jgi:transposase InsO family protein